MPGYGFGINHAAGAADLENAARTLDQGDGLRALTLQAIPRTEGVWLVASHHAVFDFDAHGGLAAKSG